MVSAALRALVAAQTDRSCPAALQRVADAVGQRFGDSLDAVLFYGSCLRSADPTDGIVDVYALVDDYRHAYRERSLRWFNRVLPPNVFYLECAGGETPLRIKCTVFSSDTFERGVSHWFHPYLWGRFAQPVRLLRVRDAAVRRRVHDALAQAVMTFLARSAACLPDPLILETLWVEGLRRSYAAELRAESVDRAAALVAADLADYRGRTEAAVESLGWVRQGDGFRRRHAPSPAAIACARCAWTLRRWQGRLLSILRLIKNSITFRGGVDYVAWKIERHTGVHVEVTPRLRRFPLIFGWPLLFRLLRKGAVR